jgi:hypothetical protein
MDWWTRDDVWLPWLLILAGAMLALWAATGEGHEFYADQESPAGQKCCNGVDCAPRPIRFNAETMELEILILDRWWPAVDPRWHLGPSPDGSWHGCMLPRDTQPRCVWGGAGA